MSKTWKVYLALALVLAIVCTVLLFVMARTFSAKFEPEVRNQVVQYLAKRFQARVALESLHIQIPNVSTVGLLVRHGRGTIASVEGRNLSISRPERADLPPMLSVASFQFDFDLGMLRQTQPRVAQVTLNGMTIVVPPKDDRPHMGNESSGPKKSVVIGRLDILNARLVVLPKMAGRKPLDFALEEIHLESAGPGQRMDYQATLTNPRPPGFIHSQGKFGPWNSNDPGQTPLEGDYDFSKADLSVFNVIAGTLHSSGHFLGTLSAVRARGEATVPDFQLKSSGNRVPLETQFDVLVDGTNGNTILQPVHARLRNTTFQTSGGIIEHEMGGRRAITLNVIMPNGHIEDLLLLAVKGKPFMSGLIRMQSTISIPPLSGTVKEKLKLDGTFDINRGEFLRDAVQDKVDELSRRGQGRPSDTSVDNVFSHMSGAFRLEDQVISFSRLNFGVSGAEVGLHGQYGMENDLLNFHGNLRLQAKVSQTVEGWKHWLAKPLDPFLARNGAGTFLKIQVVGTTKKPEFGRDRGQ